MQCFFFLCLRKICRNSKIFTPLTMTRVFQVYVSSVRAAPSHATASQDGTVRRALRWTTSVCTDPARMDPPVTISVVPMGPAGITVPVYPVSQVRVYFMGYRLIGLKYNCTCLPGFTGKGTLWGIDWWFTGMGSKGYQYFIGYRHQHN